jgi:hypothetical protein
MDRKAEFEVVLDLANRTIFIRMTGLFSEADMHAWAKQYHDATDKFQGFQHMVIADMRGMKTVHPSIASIMGGEIGYAREHGVVLCAHLSDDTVQRLQARRIARQNSPSDNVTVDVGTIEEARKVVHEAKDRIDDASSVKSIRLSFGFAGSAGGEPSPPTPSSGTAAGSSAPEHALTAVDRFVVRDRRRHVPQTGRRRCLVDAAPRAGAGNAALQRHRRPADHAGRRLRPLRAMRHRCRPSRCRSPSWYPRRSTRAARRCSLWNRRLQSRAAVETRRPTS